LAKRGLLSAYHSDDHHVINEKIEGLNHATQSLAENIMNTAVRGALKGTKVE
jgi:molecular chaperone DnaK